jgi:hypothetical protein
LSRGPAGSQIVIVSFPRIMLSTLAFTLMLLTAGLIQAILALFAPGHAGMFCLANRGEADAAEGIVGAHNSH